MVEPKLPDGFVIEELVCPDVHRLLGDLAIRLFDPALLEVLAALRADFGPLIVNDWHRGGTFRYRGLRPLTYSGGVPRSQHRLGAGLDCHSPRVPVDTMRNEVIRRASAGVGAYGKIGGVELGVSWLHVDVRPRVNGRVLLFTRG